MVIVNMEELASQPWRNLPVQRKESTSQYGGIGSQYGEIGLKELANQYGGMAQSKEGISRQYRGIG